MDQIKMCNFAFGVPMIGQKNYKNLVNKIFFLIAKLTVFKAKAVKLGIKNISGCQSCKILGIPFGFM
jgi:hypothetical protein